MRAVSNLKVLVAAILLLMLVGMAGFHLIEGWTWFDGFYMVLTTFTTIGYQEVHPLSHAGRIFNALLIIVGVLLVFLIIGTLTQALLEFEFEKLYGRRKMDREIGKLTGHYVICGAGRVGRSAARELARKPVPFVVIENSDAKAQRLEPGWLAIVGDATQEKVLRGARIEHARGLVAATTTDATNIYIVLTARGINPTLRIIARASEEDAEKHLVTAGADTVISPYAFAGHRIAQSFLRPNVLDFLDVATARKGREHLGLEIEEVLIDPSSAVAGATIESSKIRQGMGVIVLAIKRESGMVFNPSPDDRIQPGDHLIAMGEPGSLKRLEETAAGSLRR